MRARALSMAVGAVVCVGCGGGGVLETRYVAVHNALAASGLNQTGAISAGSLSQGTEASIPMQLAADSCYTFVALGTDGAANVDVRVFDAAGTQVAADNTQDANAAARYCATATANYTIKVRMTGGSGSYMLAGYVGGQGGTTGPGPGPGPTPGTGGGTCAAPIALEVGHPVQGNTQGHTAAISGSCIGGDAPEVVYRLHIAQRSQVQIRAETQYDGAVYVLRDCNNPQTEVACNDDAGDTQHAAVDATLDPGDYFVVVDGYQSESGAFELIASVATAQPVGNVCGQAPALPLGRAVTGTTQGQTDSFQATCAGGAHSPDRVYQLTVPQRSRLRISQTSVHDGALYVRRQCQDAQTEIACNDDFRDRQHSLVTMVVDAGRYFVYSDGYAQGQAGDYTLQADLAPDAGGNAQADTCAAPGVAQNGAALAVDTFQARDDAQGSCGGQGAPDVVYRVDVQNRGRLRATMTDPQFNGVMYLQQRCGDTTSELQCTAPQQGPQGVQGGIDATVQPGTYFLVVDGVSANDFGQAQVAVQFEDTQALERTCRNAPTVTPGRRITGTTAGQPNNFTATCAGNAESGDQVYKIVLARRATVRISVEADYDAALHLRRDCADGTTELGCNDDSTDNRHSFLENTLERGTYFVIVDGFRTGNTGSFTLDVQVQ